MGKNTNKGSVMIGKLNLVNLGSYSKQVLEQEVVTSCSDDKSNNYGKYFLLEHQDKLCRSYEASETGRRFQHSPTKKFG